MSLKQQFKKLLTGISIPREYCCIEMNDLQYPLSVFATAKGNITDVTTSHILLGYKPLIIGLNVPVHSSGYDRLAGMKRISLNFKSPEVAGNKLVDPDLKVATLQLDYVSERILDAQATILYKGVEGHHVFLSTLQQFVNRQRERIQKRAPGNVGLPGNLLDQVQIAYSVPRKISIITVGNDGLFNMFPTDLHGEINNMKYVSSLRIGGKANEQVERYQKVVISDVDASFCNEAFALGKNHMMELRPPEMFTKHSKRSEMFEFILPEAVTAYKEMKLLDSFYQGIHCIHYYEVINHKVLRRDAQTLGHIHRVYAEWRAKNGLQTTLFFSDAV